MSDLISRRELINFLRTENQKCITSTGYELSFGVIATLIECQPTAYDPGKVVEELEKNKRKLFSFAKDYSEIGNPEMAEIYEDRAGEYIKAIEIVKRGVIAKNCNNCANYTEPDEVDNGCYLCCKGYENNYKPKADNGGASDDVCEWRIVDRPHNLPIYNTSCGKIRLQYATGVDVYCNGCGKKIKVVE